MINAACFFYSLHNLEPHTTTVLLAVVFLTLQSFLSRQQENGSSSGADSSRTVHARQQQSHSDALHRHHSQLSVQGTRLLQHGGTYGRFDLPEGKHIRQRYKGSCQCCQPSANPWCLLRVVLICEGSPSNSKAPSYAAHC